MKNSFVVERSSCLLSHSCRIELEAILEIGSTARCDLYISFYDRFLPMKSCVQLTWRNGRWFRARLLLDLDAR